MKNTKQSSSSSSLSLHPSPTVPSPPSPPSCPKTLQQHLYVTIYKLSKFHCSKIFLHPPPQNIYPGYYSSSSFTTKYMDLSTIMRKLKNNEYRYMAQVYQDLILISKNCYLSHKGKQNQKQIQKIIGKYVRSLDNAWGHMKKQLKRQGISQYQKMVGKKQVCDKIQEIQNRIRMASLKKMQRQKASKVQLEREQKKKGQLDVIDQIEQIIRVKKLGTTQQNQSQPKQLSQSQQKMSSQFQSQYSQPQQYSSSSLPHEQSSNNKIKQNFLKQKSQLSFQLPPEYSHSQRTFDQIMPAIQTRKFKLTNKNNVQKQKQENRKEEEQSNKNVQPRKQRDLDDIMNQIQTICNRQQKQPEQTNHLQKQCPIIQKQQKQQQQQQQEQQIKDNICQHQNDSTQTLPRSYSYSHLKNPSTLPQIKKPQMLTQQQQQQQQKSQCSSQKTVLIPKSKPKQNHNINQKIKTQQIVKIPQNPIQQIQQNINSNNININNNNNINETININNISVKLQYIQQQYNNKINSISNNNNSNNNSNNNNNAKQISSIVSSCLPVVVINLEQQHSQLIQSKQQQQQQQQQLQEKEKQKQQKQQFKLTYQQEDHNHRRQQNQKQLLSNKQSKHQHEHELQLDTNKIQQQFTTLIKYKLTKYKKMLTINLQWIQCNIIAISCMNTCVEHDQHKKYMWIMENKIVYQQQHKHKNKHKYKQELQQQRQRIRQKNNKDKDKNKQIRDKNGRYSRSRSQCKSNTSKSSNNSKYSKQKYNNNIDSNNQQQYQHQQKYNDNNAIKDEQYQKFIKQRIQQYQQQVTNCEQCQNYKKQHQTIKQLKNLQSYKYLSTFLKNQLINLKKGQINFKILLKMIKSFNLWIKLISGPYLQWRVKENYIAIQEVIIKCLEKIIQYKKLGPEFNKILQQFKQQSEKQYQRLTGMSDSTNKNNRNINNKNTDNCRLTRNQRNRKQANLNFNKMIQNCRKNQHQSVKNMDLNNRYSIVNKLNTNKRNNKDFEQKINLKLKKQQETDLQNEQQHQPVQYTFSGPLDYEDFLSMLQNDKLYTNFKVVIVRDPANPQLLTIKSNHQQNTSIPANNFNFISQNIVADYQEQYKPPKYLQQKHINPINSLKRLTPGIRNRTPKLNKIQQEDQQNQRQKLNKQKILQEDQNFIYTYSFKSNRLVLEKYREKLEYDWGKKQREIFGDQLPNYEKEGQTGINGQNDKWW